LVLQSLTEKWKNVRFRKPAWQSLKALQRALRASRHVGSCLLSYARCTFNVRGCACADVHARISTSVNQPMQILPALHSVAESWNLETSAHTYRLKFSFPFWNTDGGKMLEVSEVGKFTPATQAALNLFISSCQGKRIYVSSNSCHSWWHMATIVTSSSIGISCASRVFVWFGA
jgi:hypothetical protein